MWEEEARWQSAACLAQGGGWRKGSAAERVRQTMPSW
uniref:Uncharacterized protein n=1 Tax=Arundo donax TaxID=35708 RepID=A0A0A9BDG3_ARUDO